MLEFFCKNSSQSTHYSPVLLFYTPWKHQKTFRFSDVFKGCRKLTPGCNELTSIIDVSRDSRYSVQSILKTVNIFNLINLGKNFDSCFNSQVTSCGRYLPETLPILGHCSYLFQYCPLFRSHCCRTVPNMEVKKKYWLKSIKLTIIGFCILIGFPCMEFTKSSFFRIHWFLVQS